MPILSVQVNEPGQAGVTPGMCRILTNDTLAEVIVTGYLNHIFAENIPLMNGMMALVQTKPSPNSSVTNASWLAITFASGNWSLTPTAVAPGSVATPTIANHIAAFTDTIGSLGENVSTAINGGNIQAGLSGTAGFLASFPGTAAKGSLRVTGVANTGDTLVTISNAAHGQASVYSIPDSGSSTANFIVSKTTGTQSITVGSLSVAAGNISAGSSGTAGTLSSFPTTAAKGSFKIAAVDNTGDTLVTLSNVAHGQATVYSIPDAGNALGRVLVGATATPFTTANLLKASGTGGLVADAGASVIAATTAAYAGGGTSNAYTATGLTTTSIVTAVILASTNSVSICKAVPTSNVLTITFSADPGANTTVSYIAFSAAI